MFDELHASTSRSCLHVVIRPAAPVRGTGARSVRPEAVAAEDAAASCYWNAASSRLRHSAWTAGGPTRATARHRLRGWLAIRMYWEAPQLDRPDQRPFALHRNGYAGMQRYAAFLWSGDVYSTVGNAEDPRADRDQHGADAASPIGARTSAASSRPRSSPASSTCAGSSSARSARCSARTAGLEAAPAVGLEHRRARPERDPSYSDARHPGSRANCTTPRSSRSAGSISSCAIG